MIVQGHPSFGRLSLKCKFSDIEDAFFYVSSGMQYEHYAYIEKKTGQIRYCADSECTPEELMEE